MTTPIATFGALNRRSTRMASQALPLIVAVCVATLAVVAVTKLTASADHHRDAQVRLAQVASDLNLLSNVPWRLAIPDAGTPGGVRTLVSTTEAAISSSLALLPTTPFGSAANAALASNFVLTNRILALLEAHHTTPATLLLPGEFRTLDVVNRSLTVASRAYAHQATNSLHEADADAGAAILALLVAFAGFYGRLLLAWRRRELLTAALRQSQAHLCQAQELAGIGSWEWRRSEQAFDASTQMTSLHGQSEQTPAPKASDMLAAIDPDDRERVQSALVNAWDTKTPLSIEYRVVDGESTRIIHCATTLMIDEAGGPIGLIGTCQDISERLRGVAAERANQAKTNFLSRVSHELRTPLNAILGFSMLLASSKLEGVQQGNVRHVLRAGEHLLTLIDDVLDISRIESGDLRLSLEPVAVAAAAADAVALLAPIATAHEVTVTVEATNAWVHADAQRLRQVLVNLLSNAVKYNQRGGQVSISVTPAATGRVAITVTDDGQGIPTDVIGRLFEPFERLGADQTAVEGTGLGLALSKGLTESMGGVITAASTPGMGSTFVVDLAASEPLPYYVHTASAGPSKPAASDGVAKVVLCIEDNPSNLALIEQIFEARPAITLLTTQQGSIGIDLACKHPVDLVLLDLNLPDMPGESVLKTLRGDPATEHLPVLVVSADATSSTRKRLLELGADGFVVKPINPADFLSTVDHALRATMTGTTR